MKKHMLEQLSAAAAGFAVCVSLAVTAASAAGAAEPNCAEAKGWTPVAALTDEFDGRGLDESKWDDWCRTFQGRSADRRYTATMASGFAYEPGNVAVTNGELTLTARMMTAAELNTRRNRYLCHGPYSLAIVKSKARNSYGYYEIRAKTMKACVANNFWLYDAHSDDPRVRFSPGDFSEEIDIFETVGKADFNGKKEDFTKTYFNTYHLYATPYLEGVVNLRKIAPASGTSTKVGFDFCDDWHVYGFLWTPEKLVWYLDGQVTREAKNEHFHRPLHVVFNCEVYVDWFGVPDPADFPAKYRIDYVRVWEGPGPRNAALLPRTKIEPDGYNWFERHEKILKYAKGADPEIVFVGDSITHFWAGVDTIGGEFALPRWKAAFGKYRTLNLGFGWDRTGNVLWRLDHGEMDGIDPKLVVVHIGGNNYTKTKNYPGNTAEEVAEGVLAVAAKVHEKAPNAKVVVMGVFPFGERPDAPHRVKARATNAILAREVPRLGYAAFVDLTARQVRADGVYPRELARDFVHPTDAGYAIWLDALKPYLPSAEEYWMWGHHPDSFDVAAANGENYNFPKGRRIDMADACRALGVGKCCVVRWRGLPAYPYDDYARQFTNLDEIAWSIVDSGKESFVWKQDEALRLAGLHKNLTTFFLDDFFNGDWKKLSPGDLMAFKRRARAVNPESRLACVLYADENGINPEFKPSLDVCDVVSLWFWNGKSLSTMRSKVEELRRLIGPEKKVLLGVYLWDFGGKKPLTRGETAAQLATAEWLLDRKLVNGIIFHCTPLVDLNLDSVDCARGWLWRRTAAEH